MEASVLRRLTQEYHEARQRREEKLSYESSGLKKVDIQACMQEDISRHNPRSNKKPNLNITENNGSGFGPSSMIFSGHDFFLDVPYKKNRP